MSERCERCGETFDNLDQLIAHAGARTSHHDLPDPFGSPRAPHSAAHGLEAP